jgi:2-polyprenyl-3-methyl-5-hydroxy-6-metoxy-1,4-benzoquinol methylase
MPGMQLRIDPEGRPYSLYEGVDYREFWNVLRRRKLDELEHAIVRKLLPNSGRRIIDVGCGYGRLAECYLDRFQQVIMVDGSMSLLRQAVEKTRGQAIYIASDVTHLPFRTSSFDAVLMIRVFHHIADSGACFFELHRLLCNDGRFVFSYKNEQHALNVIQWLIGAHKENPYSTVPVGGRPTIISHRPKVVHRMLLGSGFSSIQYYGVGMMDWLADRIGFADRWIPPGEHLAPFFGRYKIAPWILCGADARGHTSLIDASEITDLLQCPSCGGSVSMDQQGYQCLVCKSIYPVEDGIIDMRVQ